MIAELLNVPLSPLQGRCTSPKTILHRPLSKRLVEELRRHHAEHGEMRMNDRRADGCKTVTKWTLLQPSKRL